MANGHGGARRGAGRPKGSKTTPRGPVEIDPNSIDPRAVLAAIAVDPKASAMSRVNACNALLEYDRKVAKDAVPTVGGAKSVVLERALRAAMPGRPN